MMDDYAGILRRRAESFLKDAVVDFERGDYDLALFHVEQFIQLSLKRLLYAKLGDYPKKRSVVRLLGEVLKLYDDEKLKTFYEENLEKLYLLEEAYVTSRYLPREYDRRIAEKMLRFAEEFREVLKCVEKR